MRGKPLVGQLDIDGEPYEPPPPPPRPSYRGPVKPTWGRLRKQDRECDACFTDQHEDAKRGKPVGRRRTARYRRSVKGQAKELLCHQHADLRREQDKLPPLDHDKNGTRA